KKKCFKDCLQRCLNGGLCTVEGTCDCSDLQALGNRCQIVPNTGEDREGICKSWGQYHFETFDGIYFYFPGNCSYIFAKDCSTEDPQYTVWVHNSPRCNGSVYSCYRYISLFFFETEEITIAGHEVKTGGKRLTLPQMVKNVFIERLADYILVKTTFGFSLAWDGISGVYIKLTDEHKGKPCGMCGNFNGVKEDDLTTIYQTTTQDVAVFGNSWTVQTPNGTSCRLLSLDYLGPCSSQLSVTLQDIFHKCSVLFNFPFLSCHAKIDPNPYIASCLNDLCTLMDRMNDEETYCRAVAEYARACSHAGYPVRDWRDDFLACSDKCEEKFVHRDCISCCPPTCTFEKECLGSNLHCLDGCYCPDGLILENGTCISVENCPCIYHGTDYPLGSVLEQDCNTCTCIGGVWNCSDTDCPAECSVVGELHLSTFDGRLCTFYGSCHYILMKSRRNDDFTITMQTSRCGQNQDHSCIQSVTLLMGLDLNKHVTLARGEVKVGVNQVSSFPYSDGGIEIQKLSSLFIQVKTNTGVRVRFTKDGRRLYVQVDSRWKGETLGLCGTFNGNLRDDFLSPAGMIEGNPQLHASSWRMSSTCPAPVNIPLVDPCDTNQQYGCNTESMCDVLNQELFAPCHTYVSPSVYYQQCHYDACTCGSYCLCTLLAHYAYVCAKHNVSVDFRSQVSECGLVCEYNMQYHICSSSCGRTCSSVSAHEVCSNECAEGCNCPNGTYYHNKDHRCVSLSQCPCFFMGHMYQPKEIIPTATDHCQCLDGRMDCSLKPDPEPKCLDREIFHDCKNPPPGLPSTGKNCEVTCANLLMNSTCPPFTMCRSGCVCPTGRVRHGLECYFPELCPCEWKSLEYLPGSVISTDCYTCICQKGAFSCIYYPCPAVCTSYGDRHYHTFDGVEFDFFSDCSTYLVKSTDGPDVSIIATNEFRHGSHSVCGKSLVITAGDTELKLFESSIKQSPFGVNKTRYEYQIRKAGYYTVVHFPELEITVLWDKKTTIHIKVGPQWKGKLSGLCGNFDNYTSNDQTTSMNIVESNTWNFGNSWGLGQQCSSPLNDINRCEENPSRWSYAKSGCGVLFKDIFAPCRTMVDVAWYHKNCLLDTCNCDHGYDCDCQCSSIAVYAHQCCQQGIKVHWRSPSVCPYDCEYYNRDLGQGPYTLISYAERDIVLGANLTSGEVFPLPRISATGKILFSFMITPGLYKSKELWLPVVSFECAERPNYFLCAYKNGTIGLGQWEPSLVFHKAATFFHHQGLWMKGYSSFEVYMKRGSFITLTSSGAKVMEYDLSEEFRKASSFSIEESNTAIPYRRMCEWRYEPCASPCVRTCSDPDASACKFLSPVEGCFPYCPSNMVLDEITLRCVYPEDFNICQNPRPPGICRKVVYMTVVPKHIIPTTAAETVGPSFLLTSSSPFSSSVITQTQTPRTTSPSTLVTFSSQGSSSAVLQTAMVTVSPSPLISASTSASISAATEVPTVTLRTTPLFKTIPSSPSTLSAEAPATTSKTTLTTSKWFTFSPSVLTVAITQTPAGTSTTTSLSTLPSTQTQPQTNLTSLKPTNVSSLLTARSDSSVTSYSTLSTTSTSVSTLATTETPTVTLKTMSTFMSLRTTSSMPTPATLRTTPAAVLRTNDTTAVPSALSSVEAKTSALLNETASRLSATVTRPDSFVYTTSTEKLLLTQETELATAKVPTTFFRAYVTKATSMSERTSHFTRAIPTGVSESLTKYLSYSPSNISQTTEFVTTAEQVPTKATVTSPASSLSPLQYSTSHGIAATSVITGKETRLTTTNLTVIATELNATSSSTSVVSSTEGVLETSQTTPSQLSVTETKSTSVLDTSMPKLTTSAVPTPFMQTSSSITSQTTLNTTFSILPVASNVTSVAISPTPSELITIKRPLSTEPLVTVKKTTEAAAIIELSSPTSYYMSTKLLMSPTMFSATPEASSRFINNKTLETVEDTGQTCNTYFKKLCTKYICVNNKRIPYNNSKNCLSPVSRPDCGFRGMPLPTNEDSCCPEWECPCLCSVLSDLSVITFDGNNFALYDATSYILVFFPHEIIVAHIEDCSVTEVPTGGTSGLCFKKLNITINGQLRVLINRMNREVSVNGFVKRLPFAKQGIFIQDTGSMYIINTPAGVTIKWFHSTSIIDLQYGFPSNRTTETRGLCGCCNADPTDDLRLPNGTIISSTEDIEQFVQSWKIETRPLDFRRKAPINCTNSNCTKCFQMLDLDPFLPCHKEVPPYKYCNDLWIQTPQYWDNDCATLSTYASLCNKHNICIKWRNDLFCPLKCPPGKEYQPCVETCSTKTCLNKNYYEDSTCSYFREECVCENGTILHRTDSNFCVTEDRCTCTDNEGFPHSAGEIWYGSNKGCCMYRCLENGSVIAIEPDCTQVPTPECKREGEIVTHVIEEGACCPVKVCECNTTLCDNPVPTCDSGSNLVIGYSPVSCCPVYKCECNYLTCPTTLPPECKEDQFPVQVKQEGSCCFSYLCVCESCIDPLPTCNDGEVLALDLNTTLHCCPQYHCVCDENLCPTPLLNCTNGTKPLKKILPGQCCPEWHCECNCENIMVPSCKLGESLIIDPDAYGICGCTHYICKRDDVCLFQEVTLLKPGEFLIQYFERDLCYTAECLQEKDSLTGYHVMDIKTVNCSEKCRAHQVYIPTPDPLICCGTCKNVSCIFTQQNGTVDLYQPGSTWTSNCTTYQCVDTAAGAMVVGFSIACPAFNQTECVQKGGVMETYTDSCCKTCKDNRRPCQKVTIRTIIRKSDCRSNKPISLVACDGKCSSATIFNFSINKHARFCKCCTETGLQNLTVPLFCTGNQTFIDYVIQEPTGCSCQYD
uniref:Otogelin like n=1 Tax=Latimeria chalumnae TaxID=7897 RepID=H3B7Q1_LATCH